MEPRRIGRIVTAAVAVVALVLLLPTTAGSAVAETSGVPSGTITKKAYCSGVPPGTACGLAFGVTNGPYAVTFVFRNTQMAFDERHWAGTCDKPPGLICFYDDLRGTPDLAQRGGQAMYFIVTGENVYIEGTFPDVNY